MTKTIGTVNGYSVSPARFGRKAFTFNGTTRGLVDSAVSNGATIGATISASFGGGFRDYVLYANPADARCNGIWAREIKA